MPPYAGTINTDPSGSNSGSSSASNFLESLGNGNYSTQPDTAPYADSFVGKAFQYLANPNNAQFLNGTPQRVLGNVSDTLGNVGNAIENAGYSSGESENQKAFITQMLGRGYNKDAIMKAMDRIQSEGGFQGSWRNNKIAGTLSSIASAPFKAASQLAGGESKFAQGSFNLFDGKPALGAAQMAQGAIGSTMGAFGTAVNATPFGALANTAFFSKPVSGAINDYVSQPIQRATANVQGALGFDPNSEASQSVQQSAGMLAPLAAMGGIAKMVPGRIPEGETPIQTESAFKPVSDAVSSAKQHAMDFIEKEVTGLSKSDINGIRSNPYVKDLWSDTVDRINSPEGVPDVKQLQTEYVSKVSEELKNAIEERKNQLSENGPVYDSIRQAAAPVSVKEIYANFDKVLSANGLKAVFESDKDGNPLPPRIEKVPGIASAQINASDIAKIESLYQGILAEAKGGDTIDAGLTLDSRKLASDLSKYDATGTTKGTSVIRQMRTGIDKVAKSQIPGLAEIDKNFSDKLSSLEEAQEGLVYKQGDRRGEFKDNFGSLVKNILTDRNSALRERLEEVMPDLSARIEAVNQIGKLFSAYTKENKLFKYATGGAGAVGGFAVGGPIGAIKGFILGSLANKTNMALKQRALDKILGTMSDSGVERLKNIEDAIQKGKDMSEEDAKFVESVKQKVENYKSSKDAEK